MLEYEYSCLDCKIIYIKNKEIDESSREYLCNSCGFNLTRIYYNTDRKPSQAGFYSTNKECEIK